MSAAAAGDGCASTRCNIVAGLVVALPADPDRGDLRLLLQRSRQGSYNYTWVGFTLEHWAHAFSRQELTEALLTSLKLALPGDRDLDDHRDADGAGAGPPQVLRPAAGELPDRDPDGDARGRDRAPRCSRSSSSTAALARVPDAADRPRDVLHQLRRRRRPLAPDRLRPQPRGGGEGPRRHSVRTPSAWSPCR